MAPNTRKLVLVIGAGSTLCDAQTRPLKERPPLDRGFFSACERIGYANHLVNIKAYLSDLYAIDPASQAYDSLERIMAVIYADINNPKIGNRALQAFLDVIRIFNRRIAETTNAMKVTNRGGLYRIVSKKLKEGFQPNNITVITLNQDLQIEKTLSRLELTKEYKKFGKLISFPHCYRITELKGRLTQTPDNQAKFAIDSKDAGGVAILKLHGSLNWVSTHATSNITKTSVLSRTKPFRITARQNINVSMMVTNANGKKLHTFPLVVPPVNHKASIIHDDLHPVWDEAEKALAEADEVVVFGYSCPSTDFESANLLRRTTRPGSKAKIFSVIDPSSDAFTRYLQVTCLDHLSYYRSCDAFTAAS